MVRKVVFLSVLLFVGSLAAYADGIIIPQPVPPMPSPPGWLTIVYHHVEVSIEGGIAVTRVDQVFRNDTDVPMEGTYVFPLPPGAVVQGFALWVDGEPVAGEVLPADEAREIYLDYLRKHRDPALLEYIGRDTFRARVFPIPPGGKRRIKLEYVQVLSPTAGVYRYSYPLDTERFSASPLEDVVIEVSIAADAPLGAIYSPSHRISVVREGPDRATVLYEEKDVFPDRDFVLYYATGTPGEAHASLLAHRAGDEDGFFLFILTPPYGDYTPIPKDIVLVIDRSGSMEGDKISQAKEATLYILDHLNPGDRFGIVVFNDMVQTLTEGLERVTPERISRAKAEVGRLFADGGTNIHDALRAALGWIKRSDRPAYVIFLTDGIPTAGVTDEEEIIRSVTAANGGKARLFVFGVGYDVNTYLLDKLAQVNRGEPTYVEPHESLERTLTAFYRKIAAPAMGDLSLEITGVEAYDLYPRELPDLFFGSQITVLGRYRGAGEAEVVLRGRREGKELVFRYRFPFPDQEPGNPFIPKLWAARKIGYLLERIKLEGEKEEFVQQVIALGTRYGIVTPYTSFLVAEKEEKGVSMTPLKLTYAVPTGAPAVRASKRAQALQETEKVETPERVRDVGGRTFVFRDGVWVESTYADQETVAIKYMSSAYFELLDHAPELAPILSLGERVIFSVGEIFVEIGPEGAERLPAEVLEALGE